MQRQQLPECCHEDEDHDSDSDNDDEDDINYDDDGIHHVVEDGRCQGQCVAEGVCEEERKVCLVDEVGQFMEEMMMQLRVLVMMMMLVMSMMTVERRLIKRTMMPPPCRRSFLDRLLWQIPRGISSAVLWSVPSLHCVVANVVSVPCLHTVLWQTWYLFRCSRRFQSPPIGAEFRSTGVNNDDDDELT